jgi:hypothetical protein
MLWREEVRGAVDGRMALAVRILEVSGGRFAGYSDSL